MSALIVSAESIIEAAERAEETFHRTLIELVEGAIANKTISGDDLYEICNDFGVYHENIHGSNRYGCQWAIKIHEHQVLYALIRLKDYERANEYIDCLIRSLDDCNSEDLLGAFVADKEWEVVRWALTLVDEENEHKFGGGINPSKISYKLFKGNTEFSTEDLEKMIDALGYAEVKRVYEDDYPVISEMEPLGAKSAAKTS